MEGDWKGDPLPIRHARTPEPLDRRWVAWVDQPEDFLEVLNSGSPAPEWVEVRGLLGNADVWRAVAQRGDGTPLDVVLANPAAEFSQLYRLVDVSLGRPVFVTIPVVPGFLKALKLAVSLRFPVRLDIGQPKALGELNEALSMYLFDAMVESPVEFFHSTLAGFHGHPVGDLWTILQDDPQMFPQFNGRKELLLPRSTSPFPQDSTPAGFVDEHVRRLVEAGAECSGCRWLECCRGYFKCPDPGYSCEGIFPLFERLRTAADEMAAAWQARAECGTLSE